MDVSKEHPHGANPKASLDEVEPQIHGKLVDEIKALHGVKFQLALKVQLRKDNPDGNEEYTDLCYATSKRLFCRSVKSKELSNKLSHWSRKTWEVGRKRIWLGCRSGSDIARYQPLRGGWYMQLPAAAATKNKGGMAVLNVKNTDDNCLNWPICSALFSVAKYHRGPPTTPPKMA